MKRRIVLFMALMLMFVSVHSIYADVDVALLSNDNTATHEMLLKMLRSSFTQVNTDIGAVSGLTNKGTGNWFYVDSEDGDDDYTGASWTHATATLDAAVDFCTDNNGDVIFIAQGHKEALDGVDGVNIDKAGVTVVGLGDGNDMPEFLYDATNDEFVISAASVTISNLRFVAGVADIIMGVSIEAAGDNFTMLNCIFPKPTTNSFDFIDAIDVADGADFITIYGCEYYNDEAAADPAHFIDAGNGTAGPEKLYVIGCIIKGNFTVSAIWSDEPCDEALIAYNKIINHTASAHCIEFTDNTSTGFIIGNMCYTDVYSTTIDPSTEMSCFENYVVVSGDQSGMIYPPPSTGSRQLNATTVTAIATAVDALTGIGMIGLCDNNSSSTTVDSAALGGYGDDVFNQGWSLICILDATGTLGTAPSGEVRDVTGYTSIGGVFTTAAWTAPLTTNDYVYLTPTHLIPTDWGKDGPKTIYCDDGGSNGEGTNWENAKITLIAAYGLSSEGDTILVGENHNEDWTQAAQPTLAVAGVTVIGMGTGDSRPLFDLHSDTTVVLTINNAGITLKNLRFRPGVSDIAVGIKIGSAGDGVTIENCAFVNGEVAGTDEFIDCISVDTAASDLTIKDCTYFSTGNGCGTFVNLDAATIANCSIIGCTVFGPFSEAAIWGGNAVPTNVLLKDNVITNTSTGQLCIEFQNAATGMCVGNRLYSDIYGSVLDPGSLKCLDNKQVTTINAAAIDVPLVQGKTYALSASVAETDHIVLFTVTGGEILITSFVGLVDVVIGSNATTLGIECNAEDGAAWDIEFSTTVNIEDDVAGTRYVFSNVNPSVLTPLLKGTTEGSNILMDGWFCPEGVIYQETSADPGGSGEITWYMTFIPLSEGVAVVPGT